MEYINPILSFFNHPFFSIIGGVTVLFAVLAFFYKICCWFLSIAPVVLRFGNALWRRDIAIFSSNDGYTSLKQTLKDSGIFKESNIEQIPNDNIERCKNKTIFLVDWDSWGDKIEQVFNARRDHQTAVVIYAKPASISSEKMNDIGNRPNTVVVNFRGRLLNDILTSLLTTSYDL
ncbi:hypothetical protein [Legionella maceachernii]|uniref:Uncharacterized protein n=1 Tax=Legionella maceachernii TaxID=466 RepID=A0A0W0VY70_9GAMM|nr:hypothetical protein [Legionella maceachernii]KTD25067.1 hypothetical protein Lmac_2045 [Legionella maceachernii]SKA12870.1 hypothetical protein SAMN02745128_02194 [Legionella maceachernii]SUP04704.1 Uncharacterised protein [Legionella maceachernii]